MLKTLVFERVFPGITATWLENTKVGRRCKESIDLLPLDQISNLCCSAASAVAGTLAIPVWSGLQDRIWGGAAMSEV